MKDQDKSKAQLVVELRELRARMAAPEAADEQELRQSEEKW
jgi:hypothetical protein